MSTVSAPPARRDYRAAPSGPSASAEHQVGRLDPDRLVAHHLVAHQGAPVLILAIIAFGMIVGWLAQLLLGMGTRPNAQSLIAGLGGSFVGGLLASLIAGDGLSIQPSGLIGSFVGAIIVLLIWRAVDARKA